MSRIFFTIFSLFLLRKLIACQHVSSVASMIDNDLSKKENEENICHKLSLEQRKEKGVPKNCRYKRPNFIETSKQQTNDNRPNLATDAELMALTEDLFANDINNVFKLLNINYQEKINFNETQDMAIDRLINLSESGEKEIFRVSTIEKLRHLYDNYFLSTMLSEIVTTEELHEEDEFITEILKTSVMQLTIAFLKSKGIISGNIEQQHSFLKDIWFTLYARGKGGMYSSAAFEHIFLSEIKNKNKAIGLHNWIYFYENEKMGKTNYYGFINKIDFGNAAVVKFKYTFGNLKTKISSIFVGTSPELELALYTLCFKLKGRANCNISLGGKKLHIKTYTINVNDTIVIASAFPEI